MFKIGDRINIYGTIVCEVGGPGHYSYKRGEPGTVTNIIAEDEILVRTKWGETSVHPKQCRRLKPKKCRIVYVKYRENGEVEAWNLTGKAVDRLHDGSWIKFREVIDTQKATK